MHLFCSSLLPKSLVFETAQEILDRTCHHYNRRTAKRKRAIIKHSENLYLAHLKIRAATISQQRCQSNVVVYSWHHFQAERHAYHRSTRQKQEHLKATHSGLMHSCYFDNIWASSLELI